MASRLFAPASSERVDNSGSLRGSGPQTDESADNEPTKRRSSSLVGDLAAIGITLRPWLDHLERRSYKFPGILLAYVAASVPAAVVTQGAVAGTMVAPAIRAAQDHAGAVGQPPERSSHEVARLTPCVHACERPGGGCVGGSRPCGRAGGRDRSRAGGDGTGGRDGSVAGGGAASPDDRRSVAVQLQLSPDGGRRRPRLRDAAAALRWHRGPSGGRRRRPNGPQVVNGEISRAPTLVKR